MKSTIELGARGGIKIFLMGGGSGGATSPLLAVAEILDKLRPKSAFYLIGTKKGIESKLLVSTSCHINYLTIPAGKFRRYFSLSNFFDFFRIIAGFIKSIFLIRKYRPDLVFGAGSYVQVPMSWAAYFLRVPVIIHQQDRDLLLSTKLSSPVARAITTSFMQNRELPTFFGLTSKIPKSKIFLTGNPVRSNLSLGSVREAREIFGLSDKFPTVLAMGGSQGSAKINSAIIKAMPELAKYVQVIHVTGSKLSKKSIQNFPNYHATQFLGPELKHAYAVSDLVISRGGMSTITELSHLRKPAILIPLPNSPQEDNVVILSELKCAIGLFENYLDADLLVKLVRKILWSRDLQTTLSKNIGQIMPRDGAEVIAKLILQNLKHDKRE